MLRHRHEFRQAAAVQVLLLVCWLRQTQVQLAALLLRRLGCCCLAGERAYTPIPLRLLGVQLAQRGPLALLQHHLDLRLIHTEIDLQKMGNDRRFVGALHSPMQQPCGSDRARVAAGRQVCHLRWAYTSRDCNTGIHSVQHTIWELENSDST